MSTPTTIQLNYLKRKNVELFSQLQRMNLGRIQNYNPTLTRFLKLNSTNWNNVVLKNSAYIDEVLSYAEDKLPSKHVITCNLITDAADARGAEDNTETEHVIYFKVAPLLDPFNFLIGVYDSISPEDLLQLPSFSGSKGLLSSTGIASGAGAGAGAGTSTSAIATRIRKSKAKPKKFSPKEDIQSKIHDINNAAYVDGFFVYLANNLNSTHHFPHSVAYYDSFLAIKSDFTLDVAPELNYLYTSAFFRKNKGVLFEIDETNLCSTYSDVADTNSITSNKGIKTGITIGKPVSLSSVLSLDADEPVAIKPELEVETNKPATEATIMEPEPTTKAITAEPEPDVEENEEDDYESCSDESEDSCDYDDLPHVYVTIPQFPVQIIAMEECVETLDSLVNRGCGGGDSDNADNADLDEAEADAPPPSGEFSDAEWLSALMQIIMILITYQKAFHFTHNDLHTNNIMYSNTDAKYIYYYYEKTWYQVPTFGRIYKIIDFGRSIYKFRGQKFCSNSYEFGGDAEGMYNTEPYLNHEKPRIEPNYSFDLCRLACSMLDVFIEPTETVAALSSTHVVTRIIAEWCCDDKGGNMLYKPNGVVKYNNFDLYKMIARRVHRHVPSAQLLRPEFAAYAIRDDPERDADCVYINIDGIPCYVAK